MVETTVWLSRARVNAWLISVPLHVQGAVIPGSGKNNVGVADGALAVAVIAYGIALLALRFLEETYSKDLDYTEEDAE